MTRILFTGGGSGGHIYPLIAVARAIRKLTGEGSGVEVAFHYMGPRSRYDELLKAEGMTLHAIATGKIRRYLSLANLTDIPKFFIGLVQAWAKVFFLMPDVIFSKGGEGAFPVILAGWFYRIPVVIHESDIVPGVTNALSGRFATKVTASFEKALAYFRPDKRVYAGNPERPDLLTNAPDQATAKKELGFDPDKPLLFVTGGSQGSGRINEFLLLTLGDLAPLTQIFHQCGDANFLDIEKLSRAALAEVPAATQLRYEAVPYLDDRGMQYALTAADLVISRAGSNSIFEISAFGKPSILIPLHESANDHQRLNAYEYAATGAAVVIEEPNLLPELVLAQVRAILGDPTHATMMATAARTFFRPEAAEIIAKEVLALV